MKLRLTAFIVLALATFALAQPPAGPGERPHRPSNAVLAAIDANGDHEITTDEMQNAFASLKKLDVDQDGKLTRDEIHGRPSGGRPGDRLGRAGEPFGRPGERGPRVRGPEERAPGERPLRGRAGFDGRPFGDRPQPGFEHERRGPAGGPPSPQQLVQDAFEFDANNDGLLSKEELQAFADSHAHHGPPAAGPRGGRRTADRRPSRPARPE